MAGLLVLGFIANALVKPVAEKFYMTDEELEAERKLAHEKLLATNNINRSNNGGSPANHTLLVAMAWALVLIPISYGIWSTMQKAWGLFH
jgi:hypothetical protein